MLPPSCLLLSFQDLLPRAPSSLQTEALLLTEDVCTVSYGHVLCSSPRQHRSGVPEARGCPCVGSLPLRVSCGSAASCAQAGGPLPGQLHRVCVRSPSCGLKKNKERKTLSYLPRPVSRKCSGAWSSRAPLPKSTCSVPHAAPMSARNRAVVSSARLCTACLGHTVRVLPGLASSPSSRVGVTLADVVFTAGWRSIYAFCSPAGSALVAFCLSYKSC